MRKAKSKKSSLEKLLRPKSKNSKAKGGKVSEKKPTPKRVIAKAGATREELAEMLLQKWGIETVPGERFYNNPDPIYDGYRKSIKVTGSFDQLYINKGRSKKRIIDYGDTTNVKGIHKDLAAFLDKCGYEAQFYDRGTVFFKPKGTEIMPPEF